MHHRYGCVCSLFSLHTRLYIKYWHRHRGIDNNEEDKYHILFVSLIIRPLELAITINIVDDHTEDIFVWCTLQTPWRKWNEEVASNATAFQQTISAEKELKINYCCVLAIDKNKLAYGEKNALLYIIRNMIHSVSKTKFCLHEFLVVYMKIYVCTRMQCTSNFRKNLIFDT